MSNWRDYVVNWQMMIWTRHFFCVCRYKCRNGCSGRHDLVWRLWRPKIAKVRQALRYKIRLSVWSANTSKHGINLHFHTLTRVMAQSSGLQKKLCFLRSIRSEVHVCFEDLIKRLLLVQSAIDIDKFSHHDNNLSLTAFTGLNLTPPISAIIRFFTSSAIFILNSN